LSNTNESATIPILQKILVTPACNLVGDLVSAELNISKQVKKTVMGYLDGFGKVHKIEYPIL